MKEYIDVYDAASNRKPASIASAQSSAGHEDHGVSGQNLRQSSATPFSSSNSALIPLDTDSLDAIGKEQSGVVVSTNRFRRNLFENQGFSTVPDAAFLKEPKKPLFFGSFVLPGALSKTKGYVEKVLQKRDLAVTINYSIYIEEKNETFFFCTYSDSLYEEFTLSRIEKDKRDQAIKDAAVYDLYLFRNLSNTPWDVVKSDGIQWLHALTPVGSANPTPSEPHNTFDWIVAVDRSTLVSNIPGLNSAHGRARRLFSQTENHHKPLASPRAPLVLTDFSFIKDIRPVLYEEITSAKLVAKKALLYTPEESTEFPGEQPLISRHILHGDNQRAVKRIVTHLESKYSALIDRGDLIVYEEPFYEDDVLINNLVIELAGSSDEIMCIGAHLDSTANAEDSYNPTVDPAPGMHDNASGVIGALSCLEFFCKMLQAAKSSSDVLNRKIRIVLFNAEEAGLIGSQRHMQWSMARGDNIVGAYCMDMIGHLGIDGDKGRLVELHWGSSFNKTLESQSKGMADIFAHTAHSVSPLVTFEHFGGLYQDEAENRSDHSSFHHSGIPALNAGHDFFPFKSGDPHYHSANDTDFDTDYCANVARTVAAATWGLATTHNHHHQHGESGSHQHHADSVGSEHAGNHAMIVVGQHEVYLCHMINMGMAAHFYHFILKVRFDSDGMKKYLELKEQHKNNPLHDSLIVGNILPFTLADVFLGRITSFEAGIWTATPPKSFVPAMHWPWAEQEPLAKVKVTIDRVMHHRRFSSNDNYPSQLTYILFGNEHEAFMQHNQTKQPDFDHVLEIVPPKGLEPDFLSSANNVTVAGMQERPGGKLWCSPPLNNGDKQIGLSFDFANHAVTTDVVQNIWFSTHIVNIGYKGEVC